jgi:DNA-directed RNA polymerase specialized sigma24 family protein
MKKNWLARAEANTARNGLRRLAAAWARGFRQRPVVPDSAFQQTGEPNPGHWRRFPDRWPPAGPEHRAAAQAALDQLPDTWRHVLLGRDVLGHTDAQVASELGLSVEQVRDILTNARAVVREHLAGVPPTGDER